jgi:glucose-1-phosphate cytidylyltransferase
MKVVLFCGGLGMRLREYSDTVPKPMIPVGGRPLMWHLMKYYAHYGHNDFILCLGYGSDAIRRFFSNLGEDGPPDADVASWRITFAETGLSSNIGERLRAVESLLAGEEMFLANYADGLTDCPLPAQIAFAKRLRATATFLSVRPNLSYHAVVTDRNGLVTRVREFADTGLRVNGGFFIFRQEIFRVLRPGEELVEQPFQRLTRRHRLAAYVYDGFWLAVDTAKDKQRIDEVVATGTCPWDPATGPEPPAERRAL